MKGGKEREAGGRRRGAGQVRAATGHRALRARSLPLPRSPGTRPRTARDSGAHPRPPGACPCSQGDPPSSWPGPGSLALCLHSLGPEGLLPAPHPSPPLPGPLGEIAAVCPRRSFPDPVVPRVLRAHPRGCPRFPPLEGSAPLNPPELLQSSPRGRLGSPYPPHLVLARPVKA